MMGKLLILKIYRDENRNYYEIIGEISLDIFVEVRNNKEGERGYV